MITQGLAARRPESCPVDECVPWGLSIISSQMSSTHNRPRRPADLYSGPGKLLLAPAVRTSAIQINEDVARLGALAGADNAPVLQFIHDARGAAVAEAEAALEE